MSEPTRYWEDLVVGEAFTSRTRTVSEDEIVRAMRLLWERAKLPVEPSAAVGLAVATSDEFRDLDGLKQVAVVLTGGNVDLASLHELLT